jgi:hypothetical protein
MKPHVVWVPAQSERHSSDRQAFPMIINQRNDTVSCRMGTVILGLRR